MMNQNIILIAILFVSPMIIDSAFGQVAINVTDAGDPCFLNYTAGVDMWTNCGYDTDFIGATLLPFEWVTGGIFSMIIVIVLIIMSYIKYRSVIYPVAIGIMFLPISWFVFPDIFFSFALILAGVAIAGLIVTALILRTKDY